MKQYLSSDGKIVCGYVEGNWFVAPNRVGVLRFLGIAKTSSGPVLFGAVVGSRLKVGLSDTTTKNYGMSSGYAPASDLMFFVVSTISGTLTVTGLADKVLVKTPITDASGNVVLTTPAGAGSFPIPTTRITTRPSTSTSPSSPAPAAPAVCAADEHKVSTMGGFVTGLNGHSSLQFMTADGANWCYFSGANWTVVPRRTGPLMFLGSTPSTHGPVSLVGIPITWGDNKAAMGMVSISWQVDGSSKSTQAGSYAEYSWDADSEGTTGVLTFLVHADQAGTVTVSTYKTLAADARILAKVHIPSQTVATSTATTRATANR